MRNFSLRTEGDTLPLFGCWWRRRRGNYPTPPRPSSLDEERIITLYDCPNDMAAFKKRLKKEYEELTLRPPVGITLDAESVEGNLEV